MIGLFTPNVVVFGLLFRAVGWCTASISVRKKIYRSSFQTSSIPLKTLRCTPAGNLQATWVGFSVSARRGGSAESRVHMYICLALTGTRGCALPCVGYKMAGYTEALYKGGVFLWQYLNVTGWELTPSCIHVLYRNRLRISQFVSVSISIFTIIKSCLPANIFKYSSFLIKNKMLEMMSTMGILQAPSWTVLGIAVTLYLGLVQLLRFRNLRNMTRTFAAYLNDPYSLDYNTAQYV